MARIQLVAVLFCDLVESTNLLVRVGDDRYDEVRRAFQATVTGTIEQNGGRVVKTLGDGAMAAFDAPSQAIETAVRLQRASDSLAARFALVSLGLRVGISAGEVSEEDGDLHGTTVIEAARLCAAAQPGQVLATGSAVLLTHRSDHPRHAVGELDLKGLPAPIAAFEVDWQREPEGVRAVELPGALSITSAFPFVARREESEAIRRAWLSVAERGRHLVLLGGEAGVGKTRIVTEAARSAHQEGAIVLFGACDEMGGLPFQPFVEALEPLRTHGASDGAAPPRDLAADLLGRLFPDHGTEPEGAVAPAPTGVDDTPEAARSLLFQAVTDVFAAAGRDAPVMLLLDDIHWATRPTLQLVVHLMRSPAPLRLCILATYRSTADDIGAGLAEALPDLHRLEGTTRINVVGLDRSGVGAFLEAVTGTHLDPMLAQIADALSAQTDGNVFLVGELWRHLVETGQVIQEDGRWRATVPVAATASPEVVRSVVGRRLDRLPPASREVLEAAAVIGAAFDLDVLARTLTQDRAMALERLEPATASGTVVGGAAGTFRFAHAIVWRAVYDRLSASRRATLHLQVAEAISELRPGDRTLSDLAHHHLAAVPLADPAVVTEITVRAAAAAARSLAYEDAVALLSAALPLATTDEERAVLLLQRADAQYRSGVSVTQTLESLREAAMLAQATGRGDLLMSAALSFETASWRQGLPGGEAEQLLLQALPLVDDAPTRVRALAARGRALALSGRTAEADLVIEDAITKARALGEPKLLTFAMGTSFTAFPGPERYQLMLERSRELYAMSADEDDVTDAGYAHQWLVYFQVLTGDFQSLAATAAEHLRLATKSRQPFLLRLAAVVQFMMALSDGRFAEAEALAIEAEELGTRLTGVDVSGPFGLQMFSLRREQGRLDEVRPIVETVVRLGREDATWRPGLAALYAELGMLEEAARELSQLVDPGLSRLARDSVFLPSVSYLADAAVACGDVAAARSLYEVLEPYRGTFVLVGNTSACYGAVDRYLGALAELIGRRREAEAHLELAVDLDERSGSPVWLAHSRLRYASFLSRGGRADGPARAVHLARQALEVSRALGMVTVEARADALLAELGTAAPPGRSPIRSRLVADADAATLSEREREVVACVAEGMSNAQIGRRLHISQHTAANHVRSILMKTGLANRTEVAAWAVRQELAGG